MVFISSGKLEDSNIDVWLKNTHSPNTLFYFSALAFPPVISIPKSNLNTDLVFLSVHLKNNKHEELVLLLIFIIIILCYNWWIQEPHLHFTWGKYGIFLVRTFFL